MTQGNLFEFLKLSLVGKEVTITGCSFIPHGTRAKITNVSFNIKDVLKITLLDQKTLKVFDIDLNNKSAILTLVK